VLALHARNTVVLGEITVYHYFVIHELGAPFAMQHDGWDYALKIAALRMKAYMYHPHSAAPLSG